MVRSALVQLWKLLAPWKVLLAIIAVNAVAILAIIGAARSTSRELAIKYAGPRPKPVEHYWKKSLATNQVNRPETVRPERARLPDDAWVIGVVVDGKARAYAVRSLRQPHQHVINDLVVGVPVTVAYCDVTDRTHVYASRERSEPLDVAPAGFRDGEMILKIEGAFYEQSSGKPVEPGPGSHPLPYDGYPWVRTTWKEWKQRHPETDIYVGERLKAPVVPQP